MTENVATMISEIKNITSGIINKMLQPLGVLVIARLRPLQNRPL